ncbi:MBL fold metallo-hydrolase [Pedobacter sp. BS3]|uniref:MBL fold metallo-hydrolase n=1 Tax=Pedobacter sp. BS3 TaxID=2567937 RepID=UPI0029392A82|nr:MBL fold metallo-hydrolase [Pedobacter sp. BS3]
MIMIILFIILLIWIIILLYTRLPKFGKAPNGERLKRITLSRNYADGKFQNTHYTPTLTKGYSMMGLLYKQFFKALPRRKPTGLIPSVKTDLKALSTKSDVLVWFGHSSYFLQLEGIRFLVDPVFSGNASPIPGTNLAFKGSDIYTPNDMPEIDYLLITHDHYDHLDYETIIALKSKVKHIVCGLGVGGHFERWGFDTEKIIEQDWDETLALANNLTLHTTPARHFSGRGFNRNNTLWLSYILQTPKLNLYLGGDSGYDTHFAEIGEKFGPFDLAVLDNGQYNVAWQAIHMLPNEVLQAARDLKAKRLFPAHSSKFALAQHAWDEPLKTITELNKTYHLPLITPKIGEMVDLNNTNQTFTTWWEEVE